MLFEYPNELEGGTYLDWTHGIVEEVIILKTITKFKVIYLVINLHNGENTQSQLLFCEEL